MRGYNGHTYVRYVSDIKRQIKDILKTHNGRIMDNQKNKELSDRVHSFNDIREVDPFGANKACAFVYRKAERLALALHLVTNTVPENEPVRKNIRDKSLLVLSDIITLRPGFRSAGSEHANKVISVLYEIISLLDIVHASGYISEMNLIILKREYNTLCAFLRQVEDRDDAESIELISEFFIVPELQKDTFKRTFKGQHRKDIVSFTKGTESSKSKGQRTNQPAAQARHSDRRTAILKLFEEKSSISVKDAASMIPDCSEKTVQRELVSLVEEGVLNKEGERRWSTYTLASENQIQY